MKTDALVSFTKFTEKHLCQSLFFNKVADLSTVTLLKKKLRHRCFPVNLTKFQRTPYLQNIFGQLFLILFEAYFSYFPLSNIFASKSAASWKKGRLAENRLSQSFWRHCGFAYQKQCRFQVFSVFISIIPRCLTDSSCTVEAAQQHIDSQQQFEKRIVWVLKIKSIFLAN